MVDINSLPLFSDLDNIETNFRVFAGPGAGKTRALVAHLARVLTESQRLNTTRKIACITYTNVATEEIRDRLICDKSRFDVSTIHSFLYRNIVKPFCHLIEKDNDGNALFNTDLLNGHEDHIPHSDKIRRWKTTIEKENGRSYIHFNYADNKIRIFKQLSSLDYTFVGSEIDLLCRANRGAPIPVSNRELWIYKSKYWLDGIMHHEDVLYFSYLIITKSPRVLEFVRNRFPYIFIDEFQDTTELQTWIIKKIAEIDTKVGVIGDLYQSIYKFAGASRSDFENFQLENLRDFKLDKNHRSSRRIIELLNSMRTDIQQEPASSAINGDSVKVLVGSTPQMLGWLGENGHEDVFLLARRNSEVEVLRNLAEIRGDDLLKGLYASDSNSARAKVIHDILKGFKFYQKGLYKDSIRQVLIPLKSKAGKGVSLLELRKTAIGILDDLNANGTRQRSLYEYYTDLRNRIHAQHSFLLGSTFRPGSPKTFYENNSVSSLLGYIRVDTKSEDTIRTIHSAKGTEFEKVLVYYDELRDFQRYVLNASEHLDADSDDARIYYVALSRAKRILFISIPNVNEEVLESIRNLNLEYVILD